MIRISKAQLAGNLERLIHCDVGMAGLQILIYGWLRFRKYGKKYCHAIHARDYLFLAEVLDLSNYAGYDLTEKSSR